MTRRRVNSKLTLFLLILPSPPSLFCLLLSPPTSSCLLLAAHASYLLIPPHFASFCLMPSHSASSCLLPPWTSSPSASFYLSCLFCLLDPLKLSKHTFCVLHKLYPFNCYNGMLRPYKFRTFIFTFLGISPSPVIVRFLVKVSTFKC